MLVASSIEANVTGLEGMTDIFELCPKLLQALACTERGTISKN